MSSKSYLQRLAVRLLAALLASGLPAAALAKTYKADCTKGMDLQKIIDSTVSGDDIEISGICLGNITIRNKALTLVGSGPGPNGITGTTAGTDGVSIEYSDGTRLEGLTISNPHYTGVRIRSESVVDMIDCTVSNSFGGAATGIWVQDGSELYGTRLTLNDNLRGLGATYQSEAFCYECDLNGNARAATSTRHSLVSLLDSAISGDRGINASIYSYIDIDCFSHDSEHACSLNATIQAGRADLLSSLAFYDAGDFRGALVADDRSKVYLFGARQLTNPSANSISGESSLHVEPFSTSSQVKGYTRVGGFSHALFYDASTVLDGSLECDSAGDAWVDSGIDLNTPGFTITGCSHAP